MKVIIRTSLLCVITFFTLSNSACKKIIDDDEKETNTDTAFVKTFTFYSGDSLLVTAEHYHKSNDLPVIVLCHQAGYSRGEYTEIAPKLNELGFNCIALDQRSGNTVNGIANETAKRAKAAGKSQTFNDAKQDISVGTNWAANYYNKNVILWGSSYSSSLVLIIASELSTVEKVLSFSPGEYLGTVVVKAKALNEPAFLTSSKSEEGQIKTIFDAITSKTKTQFVPTGAGVHGSRALWSSSTDNAEYWTAVKAFLL